MRSEDLLTNHLIVKETATTTRLRRMLRALLTLLGVGFVSVLPLSSWREGLPIGFILVPLGVGLTFLACLLFVPMVSPRAVSEEGVEVGAGTRVLRAPFSELRSNVPLAFNFGGVWLEALFLKRPTRVWLLVSDPRSMAEFIHAMRRSRYSLQQKSGGTRG